MRRTGKKKKKISTHQHQIIPFQINPLRLGCIVGIRSTFRVLLGLIPLPFKLIFFGLRNLTFSHADSESSIRTTFLIIYNAGKCESEFTDLKDKNGASPMKEERVGWRGSITS
jgi:hypothetical protein